MAPAVASASDPEKRRYRNAVRCFAPVTWSQEPGLYYLRIGERARPGRGSRDKTGSRTFGSRGLTLNGPGPSSRSGVRIPLLPRSFSSIRCRQPGALHVPGV